MGSVLNLYILMIQFSFAIVTEKFIMQSVLRVKIETDVALEIQKQNDWFCPICITSIL